MKKILISTLLYFLVFTALTACTTKNTPPTTANSIQIENYKIFYNWSIKQDKDNPEQIKKILNILDTVDFKKLQELESSTGKKIQFYEPFYNYPYHTAVTIENIVKARENADSKNQWDRLIFNLYKKDSLKPVFEKVIASNLKYKSLLEEIIQTENDVYLVYNWGISENKNDPKQVEKVLKVIGNVDFSKLWELETENSKQIEFYKPFYNYPNHNFETIKNVFDAKTDGAVSEEFYDLIFNLYKNENVKPIIEKVVSSGPKYKEKFQSIIKFESQ